MNDFFEWPEKFTEAVNEIALEDGMELAGVELMYRRRKSDNGVITFETYAYKVKFQTIEST